MKFSLIKAFVYFIAIVLCYGSLHFSPQIALFFGATTAFYNKDYLSASRLYENLAGTLDSDFLSKKSKYLYALSIFDSDSEIALGIISELAEEEFQDSLDIYQEWANTLGERLIEEGQYLKAIEILEPFKSCCEFRILVSKANYLQGMYHLTKGDEYEALRYFKDAPVSFEAVSEKHELYMKFAMSFYNKGDYFSSIYYFEQLNNSSEVESYLNEAYYQTGKYLMNMGLFYKADRFFEKIQDYKDSAELVSKIFEMKTNVKHYEYIDNFYDIIYNCMCDPISIYHAIEYKAYTFSIDTNEIRTYKLVLRTFDKVIKEEIFELDTSDTLIEYSWEWEKVDKLTPRGIYMYLLYRKIGQNWYIVDSSDFPVE